MFLVMIQGIRYLADILFYKRYLIIFCLPNVMVLSLTHFLIVRMSVLFAGYLFYTSSNISILLTTVILRFEFNTMHLLSVVLSVYQLTTIGLSFLKTSDYFCNMQYSFFLYSLYSALHSLYSPLHSLYSPLQSLYSPLQWWMFVVYYNCFTGSYSPRFYSIQRHWSNIRVTYHKCYIFYFC